MTTTGRHTVILFLLAVIAAPAGAEKPARSGQDAPANAETIRLENSNREIVIWRDETFHYAIGQNGREMARRDDVSYDILLRYAAFDPLVEVPAVPEALATKAEAGVDDSPGVYIVQFVTQPLEEYRRDIRALGGTIDKYLANHAYLVHLDDVAADAVADLPYVRWVGQYEPAFKLDEALLAAVTGEAPDFAPTRLNIQVFQRGLAQKQIVAARINEVGGVVEKMTPGGFVLQATLTGGQLLQVIQLPQIMWVDLWSAPEIDMDIARRIGGADFLETVAGYTGQGVRGEVLDTNLFDVHVDFQTRPPIFHGAREGSDDHGTATYGINFGDGTGDSTGRGMLPDGQGIFADFGTMTDRHAHTAELVQDPYFAVFQSNSWGSSRTRAYTNDSFEMDDIIFTLDLIITQSQSNAGTQDSRPQAWAKNIVAVGGVNHRNTENRDDDFWGGASIGPAADGRVKPDLVHFYDSIWTVDDLQGGYRNFCCTSGATPIVAGHFGLFFQMWSEGIFGNPVDSGGTVFDNRPHSTTARAMVINNSYSYPFTGRSHNLTRTHQGWGMPDLQRMYELRDQTFFVDESVVLQNLDSESFELTVEDQTPQLRATMVYLDPPGTTSGQLHRINDLSLKVTSPGGTVYWGNNGLLDGNWSTPGGSANTIDVVENVFIENPQPGTWTVEVFASEVNEDTHLETGEVDADFALVVTGVIPPGGAAELVSVEILRGLIISGDVDDLRDSDDAFLRTESGFGSTLFDLHNMELLVNALTAVDNASTLSVTIESMIDEPGGAAQVRLRNWKTGGLDFIHQYPIGDTESVETVQDIDAADYISDSGEIDLSIKHLVFVPFVAFTFESFIDWVEIGVTG